MNSKTRLIIILFYLLLIISMPKPGEDLFLKSYTQQVILSSRGGSDFFSENYSTPIISKHEARKIIEAAYGPWQNPQVNILDPKIGLKITHEKLARLAFQCRLYGIDPKWYGISQGQLDAIRKNGLTRFVQGGGILPPQIFIDHYGQKLQDFFIKNQNSLNSKASYLGNPAIVIHNLDSNQFLIFTRASKDLWDTGTVNRQEMNWYIKTGSIGSKNLITPEVKPPFEN